MFDDLMELLENKELVEKILCLYHFHKKTSESFLMHKFKINIFVARKIMKIVERFEKEKKENL